MPVIDYDKLNKATVKHKLVTDTTDYYLDDSNFEARITKDGEIITEKDIQAIRVNNEVLKKAIGEERKRLYFKVFIDTIGRLYSLTNNEKNVLLYINTTFLRCDKDKPMSFAVGASFYEQCEEETGVPKDSIKRCLSSLRSKGFIARYKDKEGKECKGNYVANSKYLYSGTPEDIVNQRFELQKKGIFIFFD